MPKVPYERYRAHLEMTNSISVLRVVHLVKVMGTRLKANLPIAIANMCNLDTD